ncbi:DUF6531 domain-containing protein [Pseudomonas sp. NPDC089734]|uniref:DUF6531 domain-containing protein n=1 Tax=Pseudomonas sp. NPDC089734 TaxID=3364469 RepID=UPI00382DCC76
MRIHRKMGWPLIVAALFVATNSLYANSAPIEYWAAPNGLKLGFKTPKEVCDYMFYDYWGGDLANLYLPEKNYYATPPTTYLCAIKSNWEGANFSGAVLAYANCDSGKNFDYGSVSCEFTSQKGAPDDKYSCRIDGPTYARGNPVNVATGYKYQEETDISGPIEVSRYYNSGDARWRHNYSARLEGKRSINPTFKAAA